MTAEPYGSAELADAIATTDPAELAPSGWAELGRPVPPSFRLVAADALTATAWAGVLGAPDGSRSAALVVSDRHVRRARPGDGAIGAFIDAVAAGRLRSFQVQLVRPEVLAGAQGAEVAVSDDQANEVLACGAVLVKLVQRLAPGARAPSLLSHLEHVGCGLVPATGAFVWFGDALVAHLQQRLPDARDGWRWWRDEIAGALRQGDVSEVGATAHRLGATAATVLTALATPSDVVPSPVRAASGADRQRWSERLARRWAAVCAGTDDALIGRVEHELPGLIARVATAGQVQPVHGDLHVGQVLRDGERLVVVDWDGAPDGTTPERDDPAIDVVSLAQSADHAVRLTAVRLAEVGEVVARDRVERVARRARDGVLRGAGGLAPDEDRTWDLSVAQELHELAYARSHLPEWEPIARGALHALFEER